MLRVCLKSPIQGLFRSNTEHQRCSFSPSINGLTSSILVGYFPNSNQKLLFRQLLRFLIVIVALAGVGPLAAQNTKVTLTIYAATDRSAFEPLLQAFNVRMPQVDIDYHDLNTLALYQDFLTQSEQGNPSADLLISSAIDLQFKLANDGYALYYDSPAVRELPDWAVWRKEVFGFTFEPAVIVYNKNKVPKQDVPHTRGELIGLLRSQPVRYTSRVGTYDPAASGVGYLFATQDAEQSPDFWELVNAFGFSDVKLHTTTADILDRIASGEYLLGYNVLGSYAQVRAEQDLHLGMVLLQDYTLVMSRLALIPHNAPHPELAQAFLDFLLSTEGQTVIATRTGLTAIHPDVGGPRTAQQLQAEASDSLRPIRIGPGLLVYLDQLKREKFLGRWQRVLRGGN